MEVKIDYIFSKNKKIGSFIIRLGTYGLSKKLFKYTPSHVAILVNNKWVLESTLESGVRVISYKKWLEINEEVFKIRCDKLKDFENIKIKFKKLKNKKYDYLGILYLSWRIFLKLIFKRSIPQKNKWHKENRYFCSEVIGKIQGINYEMTSPTEIYDKLSS